MENVKLILIAAVSIDGYIGVGDEIPWRIPEDFKHFRDTTMGNILIVGYNTYLTLPEKAFEGRDYIVLNGGEPFENRRNNVYQFKSLDFVLYLINSEKNIFDKVFVIGGSMVYDSLIDYCDEAIITWVSKTIPNGDKRFPIEKLFDNFVAIDDNTDWLKSKNNYEYRICKYIRNGNKEKTQTETNNNN